MLADAGWPAKQKPVRYRRRFVRGRPRWRRPGGAPCDPSLIDRRS